MTHRLLAMIVILSWPMPGWAQTQKKDENLLVTVPTGYKIDFQSRQGNMLLSEMVPEADSVKDWTEMVTTQIFFGMKNMAPEQFQASLKEQWLASCRDGNHSPITSGRENGYPFALWLLSCPLNKATGKPEVTWVRPSGVMTAFTWCRDRVTAAGGRSC